MSSKDEILSAIRRQPVPRSELPSLDQRWITYPDPLAQFQSVLESVGGRCFPVADAHEANQVLSQTPAYAQAKEVVSLVDGIGRANIDLNAIDDPHQLETVDFAIIRGQFAVAENGAIWVTDAGIKHRAVMFICQHLAIILPRDQPSVKRRRSPEPGMGNRLTSCSVTHP